ncbi:MAG: hypothetical protein HY921_08490 [Elusimicrobia bacterium]|nr:hypothetical protein [Elusimicrobiota bacterium]
MDPKPLVPVRLEDGSSFSILFAAPDEPRAWLEGGDFFFGSPVVFVKNLESESVEAAAQALAQDMGGYWLRYYHRATGVRLRFRKSGKRKGLERVAEVSLSEVLETSAGEGCAVIQVRLEDGRIFSILAATPSWFEEAFRRFKLDFYFGPCVLFLRRLDTSTARRAVEAMAAEGAHRLCLYDTPRATLPEVLARFKESH